MGPCRPLMRLLSCVRAEESGHMEILVGHALSLRTGSEVVTGTDNVYMVVT